jgi:hypothetical protein
MTRRAASRLPPAVDAAARRSVAVAHRPQRARLWRDFSAVVTTGLLLAAPRQVRRILAMPALAGVFCVCASVEEAVLAAGCSRLPPPAWRRRPDGNLHLLAR